MPYSFSVSSLTIKFHELLFVEWFRKKVFYLAQPLVKGNYSNENRIMYSP